MIAAPINIRPGRPGGAACRTKRSGSARRFRLFMEGDRAGAARRVAGRTIPRRKTPSQDASRSAETRQGGPAGVAGRLAEGVAATGPAAGGAVNPAPLRGRVDGRAARIGIAPLPVDQARPLAAEMEPTPPSPANMRSSVERGARPRAQRRSASSRAEPSWRRVPPLARGAQRSGRRKASRPLARAVSESMARATGLRTWDAALAAG
jgi:hypothetical protein